MKLFMPKSKFIHKNEIPGVPFSSWCTCTFTLDNSLGFIYAVEELSSFWRGIFRDKKCLGYIILKSQENEHTFFGKLNDIFPCN